MAALIGMASTFLLDGQGLPQEKRGTNPSVSALGLQPARNQVGSPATIAAFQADFTSCTMLSFSIKSRLLIIHSTLQSQFQCFADLPGASNLSRCSPRRIGLWHNAPLHRLPLLVPISLGTPWLLPQLLRNMPFLLCPLLHTKDYGSLKIT